MGGTDGFSYRTRQNRANWETRRLRRQMELVRAQMQNPPTDEDINQGAALRAEPDQWLRLRDLPVKLRVSLKRDGCKRDDREMPELLVQRKQQGRRSCEARLSRQTQKPQLRRGAVMVASIGLVRRGTSWAVFLRRGQRTGRQRRRRCNVEERSLKQASNRGHGMCAVRAETKLCVPV